MQKYTVILERTYVSESDEEINRSVYVAHVTAKDSIEAFHVAGRQAKRADRDIVSSRKRYRVLLSMLGHQEVCLFGWQTGVPEYL